MLTLVTGSACFFGAATLATGQAPGTFKPVPKFGEATQKNVAANGHRPSHHLNWRKSSQTVDVAATAAAVQTAAVPQTPAKLAPAIQATRGKLPVRQVREIQQVAFQDGPSLQLPPALQNQDSGDANADIFNNPFGDDPAKALPNSGAEVVPGDAPNMNLNPFDDGPANALPIPGTETLPNEAPKAAPQTDLLPAPQGNPMRDQASPYDRGEPAEELTPPGPAEDAASDAPYTNPFNRDETGAAESGSIDQSERRQTFGNRTTPGNLPEFSCDDFRDRLASRKIEHVSLDISPPFRPEITQEDEWEKERRIFNEKQKIRDWRSMDGHLMARGRLRDLRYEEVILETEDGVMEEISVNRISEADLAYISTQWGLPTECRIRQEKYRPRDWTPSQVDWKASGLCHTPLYFEEVNLERYGHTAGPIAQPLLSSAHFFLNVAVLPYKMGIHPPNECQYSLGYYRPGDCAPWIVPPVPISLRGALAQGAVVGGLVALIP
ncbi:hypothetical protein FF011L_24610 [Roseimaritima multifibrata]|uniref:SLA1 homology domain-containing protein n=2 Tax=Roseimaritima multifibrata TaxID=1930274 RepID=A0A517MFM6_9BACT|nr:hypothetical protein FF011L_24610 [Roseimaritima multifibrata]